MKEDNKRDRKQERIEHYEKTRKKMEKAGYRESSGIISVLKANIMAFATAGPFCILAFIIYILRWGKDSFTGDTRNLFLFFVLFFVTIFIHEILHGVGWSMSCKNGWKSIAFGFM